MQCDAVDRLVCFFHTNNRCRSGGAEQSVAVTCILDLSNTRSGVLKLRSRESRAPMTKLYSCAKEPKSAKTQQFNPSQDSLTCTARVPKYSASSLELNFAIFRYPDSPRWRRGCRGQGAGPILRSGWLPPRNLISPSLEHYFSARISHSAANLNCPFRLVDHRPMGFRSF